jgi:hypothetical protein
MSKHNLSFADQLYWGGAFTPVAHKLNGRHGVPINPITKVYLGSPIALSATGVINGATSTQLPNNTTTTYAPATAGTAPTNGSITAPASYVLGGKSVLAWALDVPRNISISATHATSIVAMTVLASGYDVYLNAMSELITMPATGTATTVAGKKAFAYITSVAVASAGNSTTNTLNIGWGNVLGLPYALSVKANLLPSSTFFNDILEVTAPTVVVAVSSTASTTTGDVRGTVTLNSALNGSAVSLWAMFDPSEDKKLFGVNQA